MVHSHLFADEKALFPGNGREKTFISSSASNISIVDTGQLTLDSEKGDRSTGPFFPPSPRFVDCHQG